MAINQSVNIDASLELQKITQDAKIINNITENIGNDAGKKMNTSFGDNLKGIVSKFDGFKSSMKSGLGTVSSYIEGAIGSGIKYNNGLKSMQNLPSSTIGGMVTNVQRNMPKLMGSFTEPFMTSKNPLYQGISKWSSDSKTQQAFSKAGKNISSGMTEVVSAFSGGKTADIGKVANGMLTTVSGKLKDGLGWISDHAGSIKSVFKNFGSISKDISVGFIDGLGSLMVKITGAKGEGLEAIADGLGKIAKHKKALTGVGVALSGIWVTSKIAPFVSILGSVVKGLKSLAGMKSIKGIKLPSISAKSTSTGSILKSISSSKMGSKLLSIGKDYGGKIVGGVNIAMAGFDIVKGMTSSNKNTKFQSTGKGIGRLIGTGIGAAFGPIGMMIGGTLGSQAGQWAGKTTKKFSDGWDSWSKGYKPRGFVAKIGFNFHEGMHNWNNAIAGLEKKHPKIAVGIRFLEGTSKALKLPFKLLGNNLKSEFDLIGSEVSDLFKGDFSKMGPDLKKNSKSWFKSAKSDIRDVTNTFTKNRKKEAEPKGTSKPKAKKVSTKDAIKSVATTHVTKKDIRNVKDMVPAIKKYKQAYSGLKSFLKKNDPTKTMNKITGAIKKDAKSWGSVSKPLKKVTTSFKSITSFGTKLKKNDPFSKLDKSLKSLNKTLKKNNIGTLLKKQIATADKATKNNKFAKQFKSSLNQITKALKPFKKSFNSNWKNVWNNAVKVEKSKIKSINTVFNKKVSQVLTGENKFTNKFLSKWRSWLSTVMTTFTNTFSKLPTLASKQMSKIITQINKGIGGVNVVIGDFGGKKLGLAKYASGTSGSPSGLAVVGEQGYELAYNKRNGIYPVGLNGEEVRYLDSDTAILPNHLSRQFMGMVSRLPHHVSGKGNSLETTNSMMSYVLNNLDSIQKNPLKLLKKTFFDKASFVGNEFNKRFGSALSNGFLKAISNPFKKQLDNLDFSMGGNYDPNMIMSAAKMMKVSPSAKFIKMLQAVIQSESGGRNIVQQIQDRNSGGNEARGILQFTPKTFRYFAIAGHKNIMNPLDQLLAFFNNSDWNNAIGATRIWGVNKIDWLHSGPQGHPRFGNGGWTNQEAIFGEVPGESEVAINPNRDSSDRLIMEAIQKRIQKNPNGAMAKALRTIQNVKNQAHEFTGKAIANTRNSTNDGSLSIPGINGDINNNIYLDSREIANSTYPIYKGIQAKEINIQTKKGGLH